MFATNFSEAKATVRSLNLSKKIGRGFTLIEILLVFSILSIFFVIVFAELNPATRLQNTRDARRWNDVNRMLSAIYACVVDDETPTALANCGVTDDGTLREIVTTSGIVTGCNTVCAGVTAVSDCEDMSALVTNNYLASLPLDPIAPAADHSSYAVISSNGVVTVSACGAEGTTISVSR